MPAPPAVAAAASAIVVRILGALASPPHCPTPRARSAERVPARHGSQRPALPSGLLPIQAPDSLEPLDSLESEDLFPNTATVRSASVRAASHRPIRVPPNSILTSHQHAPLSTRTHLLLHHSENKVATTIATAKFTELYSSHKS
jgi:hypothetical protein